MISKWCCVPPCSPFHRSQDSCWLRAPFPTIQAVRWCPKLRAGSPATAALDAPVAASARGWRRETSFRWKWRRTARRWGQRQTGGEEILWFLQRCLATSVDLGEHPTSTSFFFFAAASHIFSPWFRCFVDATPLTQRDPVWICPGSVHFGQPTPLCSSTSSCLPLSQAYVLQGFAPSTFPPTRSGFVQKCGTPHSMDVVPFYTQKHDDKPEDGLHSFQTDALQEVQDFCRSHHRTLGGSSSFVCLACLRWILLSMWSMAWSLEAKHKTRKRRPIWDTHFEIFLWAPNFHLDFQNDEPWHLFESPQVIAGRSFVLVGH